MMKYSGFLLTLLVLAGCSGKTDGGGSSLHKAIDPVHGDLVNVVNNTDAKLAVDSATKTIKVSPPEKDTITIERYSSDEGTNPKISNCSELRYEVQFRKDLPKIEADQARAEKTLEFYQLQKDDLERALKEPGHSEGDLRSFRNQLVTVNNRMASVEALIQTYKKKVILINTQLSKTKYREMVAGVGVVKWTAKWDHNVDLIRMDNAGWNVEKADLPFKVKMKAKDLELLPAEYMIADMTQIGLRVKDGEVLLENFYSPYSEVINLSLYGACPLYSNAEYGIKKPAYGRIEIEVTITK